MKLLGIYTMVLEAFVSSFLFYHFVSFINERDEIVNEQAIIEKQYERELLCHTNEEIKHSDISLKNVHNYFILQNVTRHTTT